MRYKTIVITKQKIMIFAAILIGTALLCIGVTAVCRQGAKTVKPVMKFNADYKSIISEVVPGAEQNRGDVLEMITGIDTDNPETVIGEYSTVLKENAERESYVPENGFETANENSTPSPAEPLHALSLPSHEQICASVGLKISNATDYNVNLDEMCAGQSAVKPEGDAPSVLIVHTHTTECFAGDEMSGETERTTDETKNVIAIGNEIASVLEGYGIKTLHDTTYHDYPSYQGSYGRALTTVESILKENPSIKAVLDVHRDAFVYEDGSRLRVSCQQNGIETAQVMLVVGTNSMGLWHDNWRDNLTFAAKIQNAAEIMYPGLMRPVNLRTERFNGHTTRGSLILEVGSNGNTLEEAKEGGRDVARAIAAAILNG